MRKYKYIPFYWLLIFVFFIIGQKLNFVVRGMPIGGHSWSQIWDKLPYFIICTTIMAFVFNQITNEIIKNKIVDMVATKKRIVEREKFPSSPDTHECRVCGYYSNDLPWGEDGKSPSYQICHCCGVQFGKEDITLDEIKKYRNEWITKGGKWFVKDEKPEQWNMELQMKNIQEKFK